MKEVFLALKPDDNGRGLIGGPCPGTCLSSWIHDTSLISQFMALGWHVYRCTGFQLVEEVTISLKTKDENGCPESTQSDHECGR